MNKENHKPTLGENTTINYVDYYTGTFGGKQYGMFEIYLDFFKEEYFVNIEENHLYSEVEKFSLKALKPKPQLAASLSEQLESLWPELVAICNQEKRNQQESS